MHIHLRPEFVPWDIHQEHTGVCKVVREQELTAHVPGTPNSDRLVSIDLGLVEPPDQCRDHVAILRVVVVTDPIEIRWHDRAVVGPVLDVVGLTHLDPGDLSDRVGLIRGLKRAGQ